MESATWKLVNPEGLVQIPELKINPHPKELAGKTVVLYWNLKHNGDVLLSHVGKLLAERVPGVKVIKGWEAAPATKRVTSTPATSRELARELADLKPDIVLGSSAD
jgi:hypothetical protein